MAKKTAYVPNAIDADGDGIVQDGTIWERPVGKEYDVDPADMVENEDTTPEVTEDVLPAPTPVLDSSSWVADESLSYAAVADRFLPAGMKKHDYAVYLHELNKGKPINPGTVVIL